MNIDVMVQQIKELGYQIEVGGFFAIYKVDENTFAEITYDIAGTPVQVTFHK